MSLKRHCIFVVGLCLSSPSWATDLMDVYSLAQDSDPQVQAAEQELRAVTTTKQQTRAGLMPQVGLSGSVTENYQDIRGRGNVDFGSKGLSLQLLQPLFRLPAWRQYQQADAIIARQTAEFESVRQDLIIRVAVRYFDVLAARDNLVFAQSEKLAISRQLDQAKKRFEVGLIAITDVHEAQAAYDLTLAQEIAAEGALADAREALQELTGVYHTDLAGLSEDLPLVQPEPSEPTAWTTAAMEHNPNLLAAQYAEQVAKAEIDVQRAERYPGVDFVISQDHTDVEGGFFGGREIDETSAGVQLSWNFYQGGLINARKREAVHRHQQAREVVEQQRRSTLRTARDAYRGVITGISEVEALRQARISTQSALEATDAGFEVGTRTIVDVLDSQRDLFRARRDYSRSRYDYVLNILRLKQAAGTLGVEDLAEINRWLVDDQSAERLPAVRESALGADRG